MIWPGTKNVAADVIVQFCWTEIGRNRQLKIVVEKMELYKMWRAVQELNRKATNESKTQETRKSPKMNTIYVWVFFAKKENMGFGFKIVTVLPDKKPCFVK